MKKANTSILAAMLFLGSPASGIASGTPDGAATQTLTVADSTEHRIVSEIKIDGNNAVLLFTDGTRLTADMRHVSLTLSYDAATGVSSLRELDSDGSVRIYDLQGRPVRDADSRNGIYIVNGKKVIYNSK